MRCQHTNSAISKSCFPLFVAFQYITTQRQFRPRSQWHCTVSSFLGTRSSLHQHFFFFSHKTCKTFGRRHHWTPSAAHAAADVCVPHARAEERCCADARMRNGCGRVCTTSKGKKGTHFVACLWCDAALRGEGEAQRKTDPWPLQNHLTFTVSLFSL